MEGTHITALGQLLLQQEDARSIITESKEVEDRTAIDAVISSSEYPEDIVVDVAVILRSLRGNGEIGSMDVIQAIGFLDFASTLSLELRRKE